MSVHRVLALAVGSVGLAPVDATTQAVATTRYYQMSFFSDSACTTSTLESTALEMTALEHLYFSITQAQAAGACWERDRIDSDNIMMGVQWHGNLKKYQWALFPDDDWCIYQGNMSPVVMGTPATETTSSASVKVLTEVSEADHTLLVGGSCAQISAKRVSDNAVANIYAKIDTKMPECIDYKTDNWGGDISSWGGWAGCSTWDFEAQNADATFGVQTDPQDALWALAVGVIIGLLQLGQLCWIYSKVRRDSEDNEDSEKGKSSSAWDKE